MEIHFTSAFPSLAWIVASLSGFLYLIWSYGRRKISGLWSLYTWCPRISSWVLRDQDSLLLVEGCTRVSVRIYPWLLRLFGRSLLQDRFCPGLFTSIVACNYRIAVLSRGSLSSFILVS